MRQDDVAAATATLLGTTGGGVTAMDYKIRPVNFDEYDLLADVERSAAQRFRRSRSGRASPQAEPTDPEFIGAVAAFGGAFVAARDEDDMPVGFILVGLLDRAAHIYELSVAEEHGRQGIGRMLIEEASRFAGAEGVSAVTLSTFHDVAWNGPLYEQLGFRYLIARRMDTGPAYPAQARDAARPAGRAARVHALGFGMSGRTLSHLDKAGAANMVDVSAKPVDRADGRRRRFGADESGDARPDPLRRRQERRCHRYRADRRHHGREEDPRTDPALPSDRPVKGHGRYRDRRSAAGHPRPGDDQGRGTDRRRNGGLDRRFGRLPDDLRHGEGGRPRHGHHRHPAGREERRAVGRLAGTGQ